LLRLRCLNNRFGYIMYIILYNIEGVITIVEVEATSRPAHCAPVKLIVTGPPATSNSINRRYRTTNNVHVTGHSNSNSANQSSRSITHCVFSYACALRLTFVASASVSLGYLARVYTQNGKWKVKVHC
jgi:hypothetical protein